MQDACGGGSDGAVVEGVEAGHVGVAVFGEASADFAFDEAEDE